MNFKQIPTFGITYQTMKIIALLDNGNNYSLICRGYVSIKLWFLIIYHVFIENWYEIQIIQTKKIHSTYCLHEKIGIPKNLAVLWIKVDKKILSNPFKIALNMNDNDPTV